ncbi:reticulophagy regulator 1 [Brachionichthys hirsutus]|uniref:reticulophagy regulator 1 n=1 Tax=Brachionichthys hirsutus TaxID=412623 RepID=UPI00360450D5
MEAAAGGGAIVGRPHPEKEPGYVPVLVQWGHRPYRTAALFSAANTALWFVASSSLRAYSLAAFLVVMVIFKDFAPFTSTGAHLRCSTTASWEIIDSGQNSPSGTGPQLSDSLKVFLQETSAFKQQNPGKFCLLVCSLCTFFAVVGRYIPGIVIAYVLVLGIFLWPLMSSHEVGLWLEPVLQKLDFGVGELLQKIKENHEKKMLEAQTEKPGIESDLSSMFPKLDSTLYKEMSVSDTEASDVTWTDNGTFNLSEGHTPQTENSEDLDKEEAFTGGLPEFPSLDNGIMNNGDDDDLSFDLSSPQPQPFKSQRTSSPSPKDIALKSVNQMLGDVITAAVTAAIQDKIEAAVGIMPLGDSERSRLPESTRSLELTEESESGSEVEDFELLDQSELEQLELGEEKAQAKEEEQSKSGKNRSVYRMRRWKEIKMIPT